MRVQLDRRVVAALVATVLSFAALAWLSLQAATEIREGNRLAEQIQSRSLHVHRVLDALLDVEVDERAYLRAPTADRLDAYREATTRLDREMDGLVQLRGAHGSPSTERIRALSDLVAGKRAEFLQTTAAVGSGGFAASRYHTEDEHDAALMAAIRAVVAPMLENDTLALAESHRATLSSADLDRRVMVLVAVTLTALLVAMYIAMRTAARSRERAQAAEARHRATLEARVGERTVALSDALAALRFSEARLRAILESAFDAIVTVDEAQTIVQVNHAAAAMFGIAEEALVGLSITELMPGRFRARHGDDVAAFGRGDREARSMGRSREVWGLRRDGSEFPVDVAISRVFVDGQRLYTAILRDITDERLTQEELRSGKAKLEAALTSIGDALFISDTHGQLIHINEAFATFHGFASKAECLRRLDQYPEILEVRFADGTLAPLEQWAIPRALRGESSTDAEYRLKRRDTGQSWIGSFSFAPIRSEAGVIVGSVVVGRDITSMKAMQGELERSHRELRRLLDAQDRVQEQERLRIARDLHDDLQQTLSAVIYDLVTARGRITSGRADPLPPIESARRLTLEAVASTRRIVDDLRPKLLDDLGLVPALRDLVTRTQRVLGIPCTFEAHTDGDDSAGCATDAATCFYRVAQEALNNVAKHAQATAVRIDLELIEGEGTRLAIRDDGRGIQAADRQKPESFGLRGMAERVRAVGGILSVESAPGGGTRVELFVPANGSPASAHPAGAARLRLVGASIPGAAADHRRRSTFSGPYVHRRIMREHRLRTPLARMPRIAPSAR